MISSLKRRRIERERVEAVGEREQAARDFVNAIREAEAALEAIKLANDKLYWSDNQVEQVSLDQMRQARERMFAFVMAKEVAAEAPRLARGLCVKVAPTQAPPFIEYIASTSALDFGATVHAIGKGETS